MKKLTRRGGERELDCFEDKVDRKLMVEVHVSHNENWLISRTVLFVN